MKKLSGKRAVGALIIGVFLALALVGVTRESPSAHLPAGAKARLGRGTAETVRYAPDGIRLAVGGGVGIRLYNTHTHKVVDLLTGHAGPVTSVAFSPDGHTLASSGNDETVGP